MNRTSEFVPRSVVVWANLRQETNRSPPHHCKEKFILKGRKGGKNKSAWGVGASFLTPPATALISISFIVS